jgi:hypothetical protein
MGSSISLPFSSSTRNNWAAAGQARALGIQLSQGRATGGRGLSGRRAADASGVLRGASGLERPAAATGQARASAQRVRRAEARGWSGRLAAAAGPRAEVNGGRNRHACGWNGAPAAPGGTRERASAGLERFAAGAGAERGRRRAGGASVRAVTRGSWWCVQACVGGSERARDAGTGVCGHWCRVSAGAGQKQALEQARCRYRRRRRVSAGAGPERRRTARSEQWRAGRIQTREQQRDAGQGRARFGRARLEVRRGGSGPTRTEGNEVAHGSNLARTAAEGPATRQGRGEHESGSRKGCAGQQCAGQRRARRQRVAHSGVSAGRAQVAIELVYRRCYSVTIWDGPAQGAVESRVENVGGRRGEGNGRSQAALWTARGGFGGSRVRADPDPRGGGEALMAW